MSIELWYMLPYRLKYRGREFNGISAVARNSPWTSEDAVDLTAFNGVFWYFNLFSLWITLETMTWKNLVNIATQFSAHDIKCDRNVARTTTLNAISSEKSLRNIRYTFDEMCRFWAVSSHRHMTNTFFSVCVSFLHCFDCCAAVNKNFVRRKGIP